MDDHGHTHDHGHPHDHGDAHQDDHIDHENTHFQRVVNAYAGYALSNRDRFHKALADYDAMVGASASRSELLPHFRSKIARLEECLSINQRFLDEVIAPHELFANTEELVPQAMSERRAASPFDADKMRSTLRQCVRDWGAEGVPERAAVYDPLMRELERCCPIKAHNDPPRVLVPGAGLGRLAHDIAQLGYVCEGNEYSYFMLLMSDYIMNRLYNETDGGTHIFPYIHQFSNVAMIADQIRGVYIPDIEPGHLPEGSALSMVAGDFLEVYGSQPDSWDCVVTCFFMDTAKNIIEYVELIKRILKPGGYWLNIGPLLYHYEDMQGEASLDLSSEELHHVLQGLGFVVETTDYVRTTYAGNARSLYLTVFNCIRFTARKPVVDANSCV